MLQESKRDLVYTKAQKLRDELFNTDVSFLMEAHSALSAKVVEEAGFRGIWASGLSISASLGVRDCNEASWSQLVDILEFMSDATSIPILMDGDTGFGNFNNARRLVKKLCQRRIAGVCLEDKLFPKTNSFIGENQALADPLEFAGKIRACKDSQTDDYFCVIARTEALIAGHGMEEALTRAELYQAAGADGIIVHSKKSTADQIVQFGHLWARRAPLIVIPTTYPDTPIEVFRAAGISMVIWANHNIRASLKAMRESCRHIFEDRGLSRVGKDLTPLKEVFDFVGQAEMNEAEEKYLPGH